MKTNFFSIAWNEIHKNLRSILIYSGLMALLMFYLMTIFDPSVFGELEAVLDAYPDAIKQMVGGSLDLARIEGFVNIYVFTFAWMWYGIYLMIRTAQDIPEEIEKKTIDLVLSKPITRVEYILGKKTQQILMIFTLTFSSYIAVLLGITISKGVSLADLNVWHLTICFLWMALLLIALESTALLFSTFLSPKKALGFATGMLVLFYFIGTFADSMADSIQWIRYFSVFTYFNTSHLMMDGDFTHFVRDWVVLFSYSAIVTTGSIFIFKKRDIPV